MITTMNGHHNKRGCREGGREGICQSTKGGSSFWNTVGLYLHEVLRIKGLQKVGHSVDAVAHRSLLLVGGKATYSRITLENSVQSADAIGNKIEHKRAIVSVVKKKLGGGGS